MNRKNLTAAVLAGLAGAAGIVGSAQAVNINPDGIGQVLIYPYYTVNGGNQTLLSVINTTGEAKAVKVRFTEGQNTREVLDFNLYMSAYDVWTAALYSDDGTPTMVTTDTTCTVPYIYGNGGVQAFLPYALTDGGSKDINRTAEGHFEMIEMGTIVDEISEILDTSKTPPVPFNPPKFGPTNGSAAAATHVNGVPADCQQLVDAWTDPDDLKSGDEGYWLKNPIADMQPPSGGLTGGAAVVDVNQGAMYSYDARAINGFADTLYSGEAVPVPLHQVPGNVFPNLNSGDRMDGTVFLDDGSVTSYTFGRGVDAVSYVLMHDQILNGYTTEAAVAADTEWVVTFPTKHFYVYEDSSGSTTALAPFTSTWDYTPAVPPSTDKPNGVPEKLVLPCEVVLLSSIWDREEATIGEETPSGEPVPPIVSPAPPPTVDPANPIIPFELCYETSVIQFGAEQDNGDGGTPVLGSKNSHRIDNTELGFQYGWARLQLDDYAYDRNENGLIDTVLTAADQTAGYTVPEAELSRAALGDLEGLPVTGFSVERYTNAFLGDGANIMANYGGTFGHKSTRKLGSSAAPQ